jgi:hypothetical protein
MLKRFFRHFHDLIIYILIAAATVTAAFCRWLRCMLATRSRIQGSNARS